MYLGILFKASLKRSMDLKNVSNGSSMCTHKQLLSRVSNAFGIRMENHVAGLGAIAFKTCFVEY